MQHAIYNSLNAFMVEIGYQQASEQRDDDPVWTTRNENNYRAMMEYKFGQDRNSIQVPTRKEDIHPFILDHSAFRWLGEDEQGEQQLPLTTPDGFARGTTEFGLWLRAGSPAEWTAPAPAPAPAAPEVVNEITQQFQAEQEQQQEQQPLAEQTQEQPPVEEKPAGEEQPAQEEQQQQEPAAEEGGDDSEQE